MTDKQVALAAIHRLPDSASFNEISRRIELLAAVRAREEQADRGQVISLEQLEKNLATWVSMSS